MLTAQELTFYCAPRTIQAAEKLVQNHKVVRMRQRPGKQEDTILVSGMAEGSFGYYHTARLLIREHAQPEEQMILQAECTCKEQQEGLCRHCAAVALQYAHILAAGTDEITAQSADESGKKAEKPAIPVKPTSPGLSAVLSRFRAAGCNVENGMKLQELRLEPELSTDGDSLLLALKIGSSRMLKVRDMAGLVHAVLTGKTETYGTTLTFAHTPEMFDPTSQSLLALVETMVRRVVPQPETYHGDLKLEQLALDQEQDLERLFHIYLGSILKIDDEIIRIVDADPPVSIQLQGIGEDGTEGAEVILPPVRITRLPQHVWAEYGDGIYRCSPAFVQRVLPLLELTGASDGEQTVTEYLSPADYPAFCGDVLEPLSDMVSIESSRIPLEQYQPGKPKFRFRLTMREDTILCICPSVVYNHADLALFAPAKEYRNPVAEQPVRDLVRIYFEPTEDCKWLEQREEEKIYAFLQHGVEQLREIGEVLIEDTAGQLKLAKPPKARASVSMKGNLLELEVETDLEEEEIDGILEALQDSRSYYRLKNGEFLSLEDGTIRVIAALEEELKHAGADGTHGELPAYRAPYLDQLLQELPEEAETVRSEEFTGFIDSLNRFEQSDDAPPEALQAELRSYQLEGYRWLCTLADYGLGGILADDMGLGKTVQMIALLLHCNTTALIVTPSSLVYNWEAELKRFAPSLEVQTVTGTAEQRAAVISGDAQILVTSYDLLRRDIGLYATKSFGCCIVDEAQYIRNPDTQASRAVRQIHGAVRFAVSGTPIENRLTDLWSIFDFVLPGYLYDRRSFQTWIEQPARKDNGEAMQKLRRMVSPFILRRKKADVLQELPDKVETIQPVDLNETERALYDAVAVRLRSSIAATQEDQLRRSRLEVLAGLTMLRQLCCAPQLCLANRKEAVAEPDAAQEETDTFHQLLQQTAQAVSSKTEACMGLLEQAAENGHKSLVFSSFTTMLELLQAEAERRGLHTLYLSGRDSKEKRREMVEAFQQGAYDVFFISLKAGGTGLTLTAADQVIHFDPWWNAAVEQQASDRSHRIGQKNTVFVTKLVARNTIEENIVALQESKREMSDAVISGSGMSSSTLDREELLELLAIRSNG